MLSPEQIAKHINEKENVDRLKGEFIAYEMYHGAIKKYVEHAIRREYFLPETVQALIDRVIPLNFTQKIVNKLAKVYLDVPDRKDVNDIDVNNDFIDDYVVASKIDSAMKDANRYFKLSKHFCIESFANRGRPKLRTLTPYTYTPISDDDEDSTEPTCVVKHIDFPEDKDKQIHVVWSDQEHYTMNGKGIILSSPNKDRINPYGISPLYYGRASNDRLIPIPDDDLKSMQIILCLLLTDLSFASKFASWNLIYVIGAFTGKLSFNPNAILNIPKNKDGTDPTVGTIDRTLDIDGLLRQFETNLGLLLTTKSIKPGAVQGQLHVSNLASGVSKVIDEGESMEDRQEQLDYFVDAELWLFNEALPRQLPIWRDAGKIDKSWLKVFPTQEMSLAIKFPEQKPMKTDAETVDNEIKKLDNDLTTLDLALREVHPDYTDAQIEELKSKIMKDKKERAALIPKPSSGDSSNDPNNPDQNKNDNGGNIDDGGQTQA